MKSLQEIQQMPIHGNFYQDRPIFNAVDEFILSDEPSLEEKRQAMAILDKVTGVEPGTPISDTELQEYINEAKEFHKEIGDQINCRHEDHGKCQIDGLKCIDKELNEGFSPCKLKNPKL